MLNFDGGLFVAKPLGVIVVEILPRRSHTADVEREKALYRHTTALNVIAHHNGYYWSNFEVIEALGSVGFGKPCGEVVGHQVKAFGRHEDGERAVRQFC